MRVCVIVAGLFAVSLGLAEDEKPAPKEIPLKNLMTTVSDKAKVTEPAIVTTAEELAKNAVVGKAADEIKKKLDFDKEKLVVFAWSGSGGDKLGGELNTADKKTTALFKLTPGLTRDLRQHIHLFVVPKDAEVKVEIAKQ
jgi:hypothetical protein